MRDNSLPLVPLVVTLGIGAVLGGVIGGLLATASQPRPSAIEPGAATSAASRTAPASPAPEFDGESIEMLLGVLIDETRSLRTSLASNRQAVGTGDPAAVGGTGAGDARLLKALESLTQAVRSAGGGGGGFGAPGWGLTTIEMPAHTPTWSLLRTLVDIDDEHERVRPYLFWNYQRVLDHFGHPTEVWEADRWLYRDDAGELDIEFHFKQGLLVHIYT